MASSQSLEHISSSEMKAALVSPSRKRTRDAAYHPYANGATANGTKNTHNGHTNGNGHAKAIITSDCNGNQNSGVQHMVSIEFFFPIDTWMISTRVEWPCVAHRMFIEKNCPFFFVRCSKLCVNLLYKKKSMYKSLMLQEIRFVHRSSPDESVHRSVTFHSQKVNLSDKYILCSLFEAELVEIGINRYKVLSSEVDAQPT